MSSNRKSKIKAGTSGIDRYDNPYSKGRQNDKYDVRYKQAHVERLMQAKKEDEWSDEEGDYKWQLGIVKPAPVFDPSVIDQHGESTLGKLPARAHYDKPHRFPGVSSIDKRPGIYPHEAEETKRKEEEDWSDLNLPLPRVAPHVVYTLGERALKTIWRYFLLNDADESEMILCENMPDVICSTLNELNYQLPFDQIDYGELEEDDYVEYQFVVGELAKHVGARGLENPIKDKFEHPKAIPPCCALQACSRHRDGKQNKPSEKFQLNVVFNRFKLQTQGRVQRKDIGKIMEAMNIEYDMGLVDAEYWRLHGHELILTMKELELLMERVSKEPESEDDDALYAVPKWLRGEFTESEITMFKHHFMVIDVDGGGDIDHHELQQLCESLGSRIDEETAKKLIDDYDLDQSGTIDFGEFLVLMFKIQSGTIDMSGNQLATALMESKQQIKIFDEIEHVNEEPPNEYISVSHYGQTPVVAVFFIRGPVGSVYEGGKFQLEVTFNPGYPFKMPSIRFLNRIFHINFFLQVDGTAHIRHLETLWDSRWNMFMLLEHVTNLMMHAKLSHLPAHILETVCMFMNEKKVPLESVEVFDEEDQKLVMSHLHQFNGEGSEEEGKQAEEGKGEEKKDEGKEKGATEVQSFGFQDHVVALPRLDQMHLNVISLYMCDYARFYDLARQFVEQHAAPKEESEDPAVYGEADPNYVDDSLAVDPGQSYLVKSLEIPDDVKVGIGTDMPTVAPPTEAVATVSVGDNIPRPKSAKLADMAIGTEGMLNLLQARPRK